MDSLPPQNRNEFEAAADRAREKARSLATEGMAEQAATDRRADASADGPGPLAALLDRIRTAIGSFHGS